MSELVDKPGVTPVAVRRDVNALADRGLVVRVHSGIRLPHHGIAQGAPAGARSTFGRVTRFGEVLVLTASAVIHLPAACRPCSVRFVSTPTEKCGVRMDR
ncbi:DeoR family transcriptional regulator [Kutzneria sp. 744]|uniref:DeoR family transcriptional regulator n=1 Tax=Kutzneria sp. (strain 744) TaxID=345341 RepID=UPI001E5DF362|nr:DeoR family transcriptional regulator [Kutzneria sp. 744]